MQVFKDVSLDWNGVKYTVPANRMIEAIARIEDHVTLVEVTRYFNERGSVPLARLAMAFHAVLSFAGAQKVTADDVYRGMFSGGEAQRAALEAVTVLLHMMVPPEHLQDKSAKPGKSRPGGAPSSRKRTRRS